MKKKLVHIVESFGGGVYFFLIDLINNMSDDFEITVLYGEREQTPINFREDFNKNVKFIKIDNFTRSINLKKDLKAIGEVKENIKKINPDIIHLHSSKAGIIGRLINCSRKTNMFYTPHGFSFLKKDDSKTKRLIYWWIEKVTSIINRRCTIVGCSKGEYLEAKKLNKNSVCINNGIDINAFREITKKLPKTSNKNIKICTIGRIGYQKNPKLFNEIAQKLPDIEFTWIGDGELRNVITSPNISVTGWKDRNEVLNKLNDNDIFLLVSLWEGLPISLLEAMYMKKLCIVSNVIGNRDVIEDGINGFVANDSEEFVNKIKCIIKRKDEIEKLTEKAYRDVEEIYNTSFMVNEYKKLYQK